MKSLCVGVLSIIKKQHVSAYRWPSSGLILTVML